ncbi:site-specific DNA-methyltransferase [Glycomyces sp. TRM65418]|uniref:site-specific DNA-methyltransferase n=1 Tax=Glycomyces sp. TRM65418 TaxID=2867006 RepID=UPI001CE67CFA|nr:site-specific DNA-methyltransferase [Glycomyces sp. TRM65418]MCC3762563.1 site-specific DNA-methyltransferase [Glycomyces sp. TRM65418]QZD56602.1 site-specific DNA-methyltransferase [Glycomyces sp. TRM65418]
MSSTNPTPRHQGRLELTWTDKDKTLLSTGDGRYDYTFVDPSDYRVSEVRLLREVERFEAPVPPGRPADLPAPTSGNLLVTGDAMHVLDALAKIPEYAEQYLGKVKLVYIDPPFNTGQAFSNYEDNIEHSIWLTLLRDRIRQIRPLLAEDGSVWVHLDHSESHRCRVVLDEELGASNFVAEVAWQKADSPRNDTKGLSTSQDTILVYRKSEAWTPNRMPRLASSNTSRYQSRDGDPIPWRDGDATAGKAATNHPMVYAIQHPVTGKLMYPTAGRCWGKAQSWMLEQMSEYAPYELRDIGDEAERARICGTTPEKVKAGVPAIMLSVPLEEAAVAAQARYDAGHWPDIVMLGLRDRIQRKKHLEDNGRVPETLWLGTEVGGNLRGKIEIKELFPGEHPFATPKPERLLERILHIGSKPGDIVLDCFAGSGTTAAVAHKMGRRWVTSELSADTVSRYTLPRLTMVVKGEDQGGISTTTERVSAMGENGEDEFLPEGVSPLEAQEFNRLLTKVARAVATEIDPTAVKILRAATKTRDVTTVNWHGGGGFTHLETGKSMFVQMPGMTLLADWAVHGDLAEAMCAQLSVPYLPDGIFAAKQGRTRYVIIDGMVGTGTIAAILDRLAEGETVEVWATQIEDDAARALRDARSGSRLELIPDKVLENYRRKSARRSPFGAGRSSAPSDAAVANATGALVVEGEGTTA